MADRKIASMKKKLAPRKPKPTKAPGKPDPKFLDRLSKALRDEMAAAGTPGPETPPAAKARRVPDDPEPGAASPARPAAGDPDTAPAARRGTGKTTGAAAPRAGSKAARDGKKASNAGGKARASGKDRRAALLKELKSLLEELDEEGLDFLLEQAHVHRYNMEVERLNEAEERREAGRAEAVSVRAGKRPATGKTAPARVPPLRIERSQDGETYHVVSGGRYKMFAAEEMLALVRIAHANPDAAEAGRGLYRWMSRERTDALADLGFAGPSDPGLAALAALLRKSFAAPPKRV